MELELRSEFSRKEIEDLDSVVREYAARVDRLEQELRELRAQLVALAPSAAALGDVSVLKS